jgi:hypothetical protein
MSEKSCRRSCIAGHSSEHVHKLTQPYPFWISLFSGRGIGYSFPLSPARAWHAWRSATSHRSSQATFLQQGAGLRGSL